MNASLLKKIKHGDIILILLLGLLSLTWFRGNNLISGGDMGLPLDRLKYLRLMLSSWDETFSMGLATPRQLASLIPYALWGGITQVLGFSTIFWEKSLFYIWFAGAGLSMYYLCRVLGMSRVGRLAASIFYMFNPFSLIIIWLVSHGLIQMPYAFAPLVLGVFIEGLKGRGGLKHIIVANLAWLFLTGSAYANPRMVVVHWLPIFFYSFWAFIFQKERRRFVLKYAFSFLIFWLLLNFYWVLPVITSLSESVASAHSPFLMPDLEQLKLTSVKLKEAVRMLGYWSLKGGYKGDPYYSYWKFYDLSLINLIGWLIPILVFLGFLHRRVRSKQAFCFFLTIIFLGLLGINGANPPVGGFIVWFYRLLPPLNLLVRFNFLFFGMLTYLIFSVLLGYGFLTIYEYGVKRIGKWVLVPLITLGILLNVVLVFPFWSGEVIRKQGKVFPSERFQVPDYWWEAKDWLTGQKDFFRILPLPMSKTYNAAYDWGEGFSGGDPMRWLTNQPVLNANTGDTFEVPMLIGEEIERETEFEGIAKLLGYLNVRYLLVRNDTRWEFLKGHNWWFQHQPDNIEKFVTSQDGLTLEKEIGPLEFYRLDDEYLLPHIYTPSAVTVIDGEAEGLADIAQFLSPEKEEAFILAGGSKLEPDFIWRRPSIPKTEEGKRDLTRAVYEIAVRTPGRYEILLRDDNFLKFYQPAKLLKVSLDSGEVQERILTPTGDNLVSLGEVELTVGNHTLTIFPPPAINLVEDASFEGAAVEYERSEDAFAGRYALKVLSSGDTDVVSIPIRDFRAGGAYSLSFAAKHLGGKAAILALWENYTEAQTPVSTPLDAPFGRANLETNYSQAEIRSIPSWQNFEVTFTPGPVAKSIGLSFTTVDWAESLFDDIKVQRVFDNSMTLKNLSKNRKQESPPQVLFKKISPVKYEVDVHGAKEPYLLVFSEAFHPGWTSSVGDEHLMVNGFANGWFIDKPDDYKTTLFFKPQKAYYLGAGISLLTLVVSLGFVCLELFGVRRAKSPPRVLPIS